MDRLFHVCDVIAVLTCSGSLRLVILASCLSARVRVIIVLSANPFFFMCSEKLSRISAVSWFIGRVALISMRFDFNLPKRFQIVYIGSDGDEHEVVMIHRVLLGAVERFFAILIEHCNGNLPVWLAPTQAAILPVSANHLQYAETIRESLLAHQVRCEVDDSTSTISHKIRQAEIRKIPYILILGEQETKLNKISLRKHKIGDLGLLTIQETVTKIKNENS